jgi:hypothetical protein
MEWGGALSSFEKEYGYDGERLNQVFSYNTVGIALDFFQSVFSVPKPDYIKIDVDGIEHLILSGGKYSLINAKEILIEITEGFFEQKKLTPEKYIVLGSLNAPLPDRLFLFASNLYIKQTKYFQFN